MEIKLNSNQAKQLVSLAKSLGLEELPVDDTTEAIEPIMMMSTDELEQMTYRDEPVVIKIDPEVETRVEKAVNEFKSAQHWYEEFNNNITELLGDSDGALFLGLLAVYSANQNLEENLYTATETYHAFLDDVHSRPDVLKSFFSKINFKDKKLKEQAIEIFKTQPEYKDISLQEILFKTMSGHFDNAFRLMNYYINSGYKIDRKALIAALESTLDQAGRLPSDRSEKVEVAIVAQKIFNFTLNLIKPGHEIKNYNWFPVTIDTHMISFFYPYMDKAMKDKVIKTYKQYVYLAKVVQKYASKFGMQPHQLQAVIWMARLAESGASPNKNMQGALNAVIDKMQRRAVAFEKMAHFVDRLKKQVS